MMACTEPSSTVRLTSLRARRPAKLLFTFLTCRMLMAGPSFGAVRLLDRHPGPVRLGPAAEQAGQPRKSLDHAAGHEDDDQHEDRAEGQVPTVADEEARYGDHGIGQPLRQEVKHAVQRRLVERGEDVRSDEHTSE